MTAIPYALYRRIRKPQRPLVAALAPYTVTGPVDRAALEVDARAALADRLDAGRP